MQYTEQAVKFECEGDALLGIVTQPKNANNLGVLILVGGPQYRVGSHRQFTLLARDLAVNNIPSLRFDYRGMGDSEGERRDFEAIDGDIRSAIDAFFAHLPELRGIAIWGLCDAASACAFYAASDKRVTGLVMLNPWVHTPQGTAKTYLKHYYFRRLKEAAFWHKVLGGNFSFRAAYRSFSDLAYKAAFTPRKKAALDGGRSRSLPEHVLRSCDAFKGRILLILSGNDFTAQEFIDVTSASRSWQKLLNSTRVTRFSIQEANHTFSKRVWRNAVAVRTATWLIE